MTTLGNIYIFFQSKFSFQKTLWKCFWEFGILPGDSSNTEYISLMVNLSNTIALVFLLGDGLVQHNLFQNSFHFHLFVVSKLVGLCKSIASIEIITCYLIDIRFLKFPSF